MSEDADRLELGARVDGMADPVLVRARAFGIWEERWVRGGGGREAGERTDRRDAGEGDVVNRGRGGVVVGW